MSNDKGGTDDGVVTSAPAASVGSLLTDLLSEAKKDVAAQRQQLEKQIQTKHAEEKESLVREEARKREAMQKKLIEETRLRNQALARRERESDRKSTGTAPHEVPKAEVAPIVQVAKVEAPKGKMVPSWMMAALVLVGVGLGVGTSFALTPSPKLNIPDVEAAAKTTVAQTIRSAGAEFRINADLREANAKIEAMTKELDEAKTAQAKLLEDLKKASNELEIAKADLSAASSSSSKRPRRRRGGKTGGGGLKIDTSVFK